MRPPLLRVRRSRAPPRPPRTSVADVANEGALLSVPILGPALKFVGDYWAKIGAFARSPQAAPVMMGLLVLGTRLVEVWTRAGEEAEAEAAAAAADAEVEEKEKEVEEAEAKVEEVEEAEEVEDEDEGGLMMMGWEAHAPSTAQFGWDDFYDHSVRRPESKCECRPSRTPVHGSRCERFFT